MTDEEITEFLVHPRVVAHIERVALAQLKRLGLAGESLPDIESKGEDVPDKAYITLREAMLLYGYIAHSSVLYIIHRHEVPTRYFKGHRFVHRQEFALAVASTRGRITRGKKRV